MAWKKILLLAAGSVAIIIGVVGLLVWLRNRDVGPEAILQPIGKSSVPTQTTVRKGGDPNQLTPQEQQIRDRNMANGAKLPANISETWSAGMKQQMEQLQNSKRTINP